MTEQPQEATPELDRQALRRMNLAYWTAFVLFLGACYGAAWLGWRWTADIASGWLMTGFMFLSMLVGMFAGMLYLEMTKLRVKVKQARE